MTVYHFALCNDLGHNEDLGFIELPDDNEATAFGQSVISDILQDHEPAHAGSAMNITAGGRVVGTLPFEREIERLKRTG